MHHLKEARPRGAQGPDGRERGAVLTITVIGMTALVVITALVVDIGYAYQMRRTAQNAADAAALAGVIELPDTAEAASVAREYVTANGFDGPAATVNTPPRSGEHTGDATCLEVVPAAQSPAFLGGIAGIDTFDVSARAVACIRPGTGTGYALFAKSSTCGDKTLDISGNDMTIDGGTHSNDDVKISGNDHTFQGAMTYRDRFYGGGSGNTFEEGHQRGAEQSWPIDYAMADFMPGGVHAVAAGPQYYGFGSAKIDTGALQGRRAPNGQRLLSGSVLQPGIYYTSGDIDLSSNNLRVAGGGGVTFVARGKITLSGNGYDLRTYRNDLPVLFTDFGRPSGNCDNSAVSFSGNGHSWRGLVFAQWGQIVFSGNEQSSVRGALYGYTLKFSGNASTIAYDEEYAPAAESGALVE